MNVSDKRRAAARANGSLSRGPKTPEGKARSSQNAVKHGLFAKVLRVHAENRAAYDQARQDYLQRFQPVDELELALVEEMVAASWRLQRYIAAETRLLENEIDDGAAASTTLDRLGRAQSRFHSARSRALNDFATLRHTIPATRTSQSQNRQNDLKPPLFATNPPRNRPKIKPITNPGLSRSRVGHLTQSIPMLTPKPLIPNHQSFGIPDALPGILVPLRRICFDSIN